MFTALVIGLLFVVLFLAQRPQAGYEPIGTTVSKIGIVLAVFLGLFLLSRVFGGAMAGLVMSPRVWFFAGLSVIALALLWRFARRPKSPKS
ncbi:MAG: hypothetical protein IAF08_06215 [Rhizobacter sp.]|nr:hypothetical protein [Chlorobiales bacterium]